MGLKFILLEKLKDGAELNQEDLKIKYKKLLEMVDHNLLAAAFAVSLIERSPDTAAALIIELIKESTKLVEKQKLN